MQLAQIIDDSGVLVLASRASLAARYQQKPFDYDFPKELVECLKAEIACAWNTYEPGDVMMTVHQGTPPPEARFVGTIKVQGSVDLVVLPYSQFTMACDHRKGIPEEIEALCSPIQVAEGRYALYVRPAPIQGPADVNPADAPLCFNVYMTAPGSTTPELTTIPEIERNKTFASSRPRGIFAALGSLLRKIRP